MLFDTSPVSTLSRAALRIAHQPYGETEAVTEDGHHWPGVTSTVGWSRPEADSHPNKSVRFSESASFLLPDSISRPLALIMSRPA